MMWAGWIRFWASLMAMRRMTRRRWLLDPAGDHDHAQRQKPAEPGAGGEQMDDIGSDMNDCRHSFIDLRMTDAGQRPQKDRCQNRKKADEPTAQYGGAAQPNHRNNEKHRHDASSPHTSKAPYRTTPTTTPQYQTHRQACRSYFPL